MSGESEIEMAMRVHVLGTEIERLRHDRTNAISLYNLECKENDDLLKEVARLKAQREATSQADLDAAYAAGQAAEREETSRLRDALRRVRPILHDIKCDAAPGGIATEATIAINIIDFALSRARGEQRASQPPLPFLPRSAEDRS